MNTATVVAFWIVVIIGCGLIWSWRFYLYVSARRAARRLRRGRDT